jgi:periplasmic protein TonB
MTSDSTIPRQEPTLIAVATTALWLFCLSIGITGLILHYPRPVAPVVQLPPLEAQLVNMQIADAPDEAPSPQPDVKPPPDAASVTEAPAGPQLIPVAAPSPAIAFARPVAGPTTMVSARLAAPATSGPAVQRLVYGSGAGRQPKPHYPREAALAHEEGTVLVQFTVDESGSVTSASAAEPSPFSLLNQAAVRTIRDDWRFPRGPVRLYEVSITFQLKSP